MYYTCQHYEPAGRIVGYCLHEDIFVGKTTRTVETCSERLVECFTAITEHAEKVCGKKKENGRCPTTSTHGIDLELCVLLHQKWLVSGDAFCLTCVSENILSHTCYSLFPTFYTLTHSLMALREDLISSAISFLSDPKVQSAPLAKKVSFLESKGMTSEEIEEAMARVNGKSTGASTSAAAAAAPVVAAGPPSAAGGPVVSHAAGAPPPVPARPSYDWRDIFVAATLAGGISYGVWILAKVSKQFKR